jgi:MarR family transcriptional regulator, organic hydroperoxide resistance regulator
MKNALQAVLESFPRIYFAWHRTHVRDPRSGHALSAHQASILDHLDGEPITLAALAKHMGVTAPSMSVAVERLVDWGYIARTRDPNDRRRLSLGLTKAGMRMKRSHSILDPARVRAVLARMSSSDRAAAVRGLTVLADAADVDRRERRSRRGARSGG